MIRLLVLAGACWAAYRLGQESVTARGGTDSDASGGLSTDLNRSGSIGSAQGSARDAGTDAEVMTTPPVL